MATYNPIEGFAEVFFRCNSILWESVCTGIHALLMQFKQVAWKELNSYVHGGVHALANVGREQPASFILQLVCNSNGVAGLGAMLAASLTGDADRVDAVLAAQYAQYPHIDCLPKGPVLD